MDAHKLQELRKIVIEIHEQESKERLADDEFTARMYAESNNVPLWRARTDLNVLVASNKVVLVRTLSGTRVYTYFKETRSEHHG